VESGAEPTCHFVALWRPLVVNSKGSTEPDTGRSCKTTNTRLLYDAPVYLPAFAGTKLYLPRLRTKFGERAFSYAGLSAWNRLPGDIRAECDIANFRKLVETHYFNSVFNVQ